MSASVQTGRARFPILVILRNALAEALIFISRQSSGMEIYGLRSLSRVVSTSNLAPDWLHKSGQPIRSQVSKLTQLLTWLQLKSLTPVLTCISRIRRPLRCWIPCRSTGTRTRPGRVTACCIAGLGSPLHRPKKFGLSWLLGWVSGYTEPRVEEGGKVPATPPL